MRKQIARCNKLLNENHISRAAKVLTNTAPVLCADHNNTLDKLKALHPPSSLLINFSLLPPVHSAPIVFSQYSVDLVNAINLLSNGSAAGPSGWTGDLLKSLVGDDECLRGLSSLCTDIANGDLPSQAKLYLNSSNY